MSESALPSTAVSAFNISEWALRNRPLVLFCALMLALIGAWSYQNLGQSEDPPFTFKVMVVKTLWPGATAEEVARQVTDRIEEKVQELPNFEFIRSYSRPGESNVFLVAKDAMPSKALAESFYQVRKKIGDIRYTFPVGIQGPFINDEFGDTFGNIYALIGDGFDYALLKDYAERVQLQLLRVPDVAKVELIGLQNERIYVEIANAKLATFGIPFQSVVAQLEAQNAVTPAGSFETSSDRIYVRTSGAFQSVDAVRNINIRAGGRLFRLGDVAEVRRDFVDPPQARMRFKGQEALGIAVAMKPGGDIVRLGQALDRASATISRSLPVGMELARVADQPQAVRRSIREFVSTLAEAVLIVLVVSFFSLGFRTGLVVALSIPLVLAMTFASMHLFGIGLHKISLGALVLALGLLVDDAIIAVEMMAVKLEQGYDRVRAAAFAYTSTAFPMLTGTLITAAGFLPIATAQSGTGEYTRSIFQVVTLALLLSWVAAVVFIPYLGYRLLPEHGLAVSGHEDAHDPYATPFYQRFRELLENCLDHRFWVIAGTLALLMVSAVAFRFVQQQFFPASTRLELMIDLKLPEGASIHATEAAAIRLEAYVNRQPGVENFVAYIGNGSPRFYLPLDQQLPQASFAQFVVLTDSIASREALRAKLIHLFDTDFTELRGRVTRLENGPPVGFPVQFRVSGEDVPTVRKLAREVAEVMRGNRNLSGVHLDWEEPSKVIRLSIDQDRARVLGISSEDLSNFVQSSISGSTISQYREGDEIIDVVLRGPSEERAKLSLLDSLSIPTAAGSVSLAQIARIDYGLEEGILWRRNRLPTVTVRGDVYGNIQPPTVAGQVNQQLTAIRDHLPNGYLLEIGGTVEDSTRAQNSVKQGVPFFILVVMTLLMIQLKSFARSLLVFATAPLGLIGVTLFLLVFNVPFGFVAMLGSIALSGMIMRNSVILIDQIEQDIAAGHSSWDAVIGATVRRFRPIVLTAAAAILAMIPLSRSAFFGPMAVAIMGGLLVATLLTLLFLPALYAACFKVRRPHLRPEHLGSDPWPGDEIEVAQ